MRHGVVPATVHLDSPTLQVDWSPGTIEVVRCACPWPDQADRPRRAGVSAFGISGTNAHVILEQAPPALATATPSGSALPAIPWALSAKSAPALAGQAARLLRFVEQRADVDPHDVALSLVTTRALFDHRAVAVGADRDDLLSGLAAIASGAPAPNVVKGKATATGGTVFVFPGQGSQWPGMAVELLECAPPFADEMQRCDAAFTEFVDWSLLETVRGGAGCRQPRPGRGDAARAVRGAGVAGGAVAGARNPPGRRPRPLAGRDCRRLRCRRPLVTGRGEGRHVTQQGDQRHRRNGWHGLDPVPRRPRSQAHQTVGPLDFRCRAQRSVIHRRHRGRGRIGRAHYRLRMGRHTGRADSGELRIAFRRRGGAA